MSFSLVDFTWRKSKETCPFCNKEFLCYEKDQIPGFRNTEEKICPYCFGVIKTTLEYEYYTEIIL